MCWFDFDSKKNISKFVLQVPAYVIAQVLGSTLASGTLRLIFNGEEDHFSGTLPSDSYLQTFVIEFIITFYLMFVVSGVATDNRAVSSFTLIHNLYKNLIQFNKILCNNRFLFLDLIDW